jgi:flavin reductase (DIM6/NTAB) family NADH-FMN oxidoreductase RutF
MAIDKVLFRQVMGRFATGVSVVTTSHEGTLAGLTVNAFCSVSLDPPLALVCVDLTSTALPLMRESGVFAVNILTEEQEYLSRCFATSSRERYEHFCYANYSSAATGSPIFEDALAFVDARIIAEYPGGDHVIFLGQVEALGIPNQAAYAEAMGGEAKLNGATRPDEIGPLAYYRGKYVHLDETYQKPSLTVTPHESHNTQ